MLCTYRCQLCASWSHGHSSYYVLHFINQYLEINLKNSHEGILHFLSAKYGYNYFVELGAIGLQDKPLYNHNQKKSSSSSPSLSSQSIEIRFNNPSIFNWTMAFRGVGVALKWKMFKIIIFDFSTASKNLWYLTFPLVQNKNWKLHLLVAGWWM